MVRWVCWRWTRVNVLVSMWMGLASRPSFVCLHTAHSTRVVSFTPIDLWLVYVYVYFIQFFFLCLCGVTFSVPLVCDCMKKTTFFFFWNSNLLFFPLVFMIIVISNQHMWTFTNNGSAGKLKQFSGQSLVLHENFQP